MAVLEYANHFTITSEYVKDAALYMSKALT